MAGSGRRGGRRREKETEMARRKGGSRCEDRLSPSLRDRKPLESSERSGTWLKVLKGSLAALGGSKETTEEAAGTIRSRGSRGH